MSKNIDSETGIPILQALNIITNIGTIGAHEEKDTEKRNLLLNQVVIFNAVRKGVNKSVCITDDQLVFIEKLGETMAPQNSKIYESALTILTYINTCRLECAKCLKGDCEQRDSEAPLNINPDRLKTLDEIFSIRSQHTLKQAGIVETSQLVKMLVHMRGKELFEAIGKKRNDYKRLIIDLDRNGVPHRLEKTPWNL